VQPVSSVVAFVARWAAGGTSNDPVAAEILAQLDDEARLVIAAQAVPIERRAQWLREQSGSEWSSERLAHVEQRAFVELRRALQRAGMWRG
jgi:hypothetical protein